MRKDFGNDSWKEVGLSYDYVSYLPCNTALAATWNRALAHSTGKLLGKEARGRGKDMILAPGINMMRSPLCGRSFEYMGEDPYLVSELVVPLVQGIEENDVSSCVKHFAVNNQETRRLDVDVEVSERALREIYLPGFEAAVKGARQKESWVPTISCAEHTAVIMMFCSMKFCGENGALRASLCRTGAVSMTQRKP